MSGVVAPVAPGGLGQRPQPAEVLAYLGDLDAWVAGRRAELDAIDAAALTSARRAEVDGDLVLSMALWKSAADRRDQLRTAWDGGRVDDSDLDRIAVLIWGRLEAAGAKGAGGAAVAVSIPEACRLSDALASQLRARLDLAPATERATARIRDLRAQLERLRDQVALEPPETRPAAQRTLEELVARVDAVAAKHDRGGDVDGLLGPVENDAARTERDLIVGGVRRREAREHRARLERLRAELQAREATIAALADEAVATVTPAPRNAVPDVSLLGPVPADAAGLTAYDERLDRVGRAMDVAEQRYAAALAERSALLDQLAAIEVKAGALGVSTDPDCAAARAQARAVLDRRPAPLEVAGHLVAAYRAWVDLVAENAPAAPGGRRP
ncbi:conserved hypothetical protein [Nostocoides japonicum T1-X7]|uniref:Uncharacterized protein n=1 Tax=Nostocoides japonicum T1-X7 TaxID=1194083 RepID=A0A077M000_9MICO|nr:hypothetical protein [Tetrasphaera japonica]CCH77555.1 conserved hypothetical protein [Tetrasphaera japonica T1-X7]